MQPTPPVTMTTMEWTWHQRLRFFGLGMTWAIMLSLAPLAVTVWDMAENWSNPIDYKQLWRLFASCAGPAAVGYWRKHRAELRLPPSLVIPPEFQPSMQSKSVQVDPTVTQAPSGQPMLTTTTTTVEKESVPIIVTDPKDPKV